MCDRVDRPGRPCIVFVGLFIVDWSVGGVREEVDQPVDKYGYPDEPKGYALSHVCLKLDVMMDTLPVVVEA